MSILARLGSLIFLLFTVFLGGLVIGKHCAREKALKDAINGYKQSRFIQNEVQNMDNYHVCLKLGGLPDDCAQFLHTDKPAPSH